MADQVRVFVSHHHSLEEDAFTTRLVADLEAAGADVWVDSRAITSNNFVQKISEGLEGRQWLVLVMTPASVASKWVKDEVNTALHEVNAGRMLGVIPIVMAATRNEEIPVLWGPLQRYDATRAYEPARDGLLRALGLSTRVPSEPGALPRQSAPDEFNRRLVLQGLLRDVEHDRDALSNFLYHVQLGDESEHVISQAAGLDIWYDDVLASRAVPDLLARREADDVHQLRHSFVPKRDIDAALSKLLKQHERLPQFQQALRKELTQGEGRDLWRDYLAWEEVDKRRSRDPERQWSERQQLARRWDAFKSASHITQRRTACVRAFVETREQCEVIMGMVTEELELPLVEG